MLFKNNSAYISVGTHYSPTPPRGVNPNKNNDKKKFPLLESSK
jgi:hypothetical protein